MGIIRWFKEYKKKKDFAKIEVDETDYEIETTLATLNNIVPLPTREEFEDDQKKLAQIAFYKKEYLRLLKRNKTITSMDIMPKHLHNYKNIYNDLLMNLCAGDETDVSFTKINSITNEKLDAIITSTKLMLYNYEISRLEEITRMRLVALQELLESLISGKLFTKTKSKELTLSCINEINSLHSALVIFMNQKRAMRIESEAFLKNLAATTNFETDEIENELLIDRLNEVRELMSLVMPEALEELERKNLSPKLLIAKIEEQLEMFVYTHQDLLKSLNKRVEELYYELTRKTKLSLEDPDNPEKLEFENNHNSILRNKDEYLRQIRELESYYKIFSKFGRKQVYKKDLERLYEIKFIVSTIDILSNENFDLLKDATFTELECYQDIIFKKIEEILKGENEYVEDFMRDPVALGEEKREDLLKCITDILRNKDGEYSPYDILTNKKQLAFLLSLDKERGLTEFFNGMTASKKDYDKLNYYESIFEWKDTLPLSTIYRIMRCNIETNSGELEMYKKAHYSNYYLVHQDPLYKIFCVNDNHHGKIYTYEIPEGLVRIELDCGQKEQERLKNVIEYIRSRSNKKHIVGMTTPSTLKSMTGNLFKGTNVKEVRLNEGLESLGEEALDFLGLERLTIPSTLRRISPSTVDLRHLKEISIRINGTSKAFEMLIDNNLLVGCYSAKDSGDTKYHYVSDETKKKQELYHSGRFTSSDHSYLFDHDMVIKKFNLIPSFQALMVITEDGTTVYTKDDLTLESERTSYGRYYSKDRNEHLPTDREKERINERFREIYCAQSNQDYGTGAHQLTLRKGYFIKR